MEKEKLEKIIAKAYELSQVLPDLNVDYKLVVFEVIFKELLKNSLLMDTSKKKPKSPLKEVEIITENELEANKKKLEKDIETLKKIDRTKYPRMFKLKKSLNLSIYLLKIAKEDFEIDGLIPSQIVEILKDRFQINLKGTTISMALFRATKYVNRSEIKISSSGHQPMLYYHGDASEKYIQEVFKKLDKK